MADLGLGTINPLIYEAPEEGDGFTRKLILGDGTIFEEMLEHLEVSTGPTRKYIIGDGQGIPLFFDWPAIVDGGVTRKVLIGAEATRPVLESGILPIAKMWNPDTEEWEPVPYGG